MDISKAIIPAAGIGADFLPFTKSIPQEMLPLLNKPAIQFIVEEGLRSEIKNFFFVTNKEKRAIANYFDENQQLESQLAEQEKSSRTAGVEKIIRMASFAYFRQTEPLGLGHAIWLARHAIGKEYFGVMLPDDILTGKQAALGQLIRIARQERASVIAVQEVPQECTSSYGMIAVKKQLTSQLFHVSHLVEKPHTKDAPSNLAVIGRYVLSHKLFGALEETYRYATEEIHLTDAITKMIKNNEKVYAYKVKGTRFDISTPIGWIKAIISLSLQSPQYAPAIKKFLENKDIMNSCMFDTTKNIMHSL